MAHVSQCLVPVHGVLRSVHAATGMNAFSRCDSFIEEHVCFDGQYLFLCDSLWDTGIVAEEPIVVVGANA